jgi:hypothetical protein
MRGEAKVTFLQAYCISLPRDTVFFLHEYSFECFVLSVIGGKIEQHVCIKFCVKLGKSATETPEMLREGFGEHSLTWAAVLEWH